jgi:CTP:molybdopterin cytidylyltransferase MocA
VPSAGVAHPELVWCPRHARARIPELHLRAAAHAADLNIDVAHGPDSIPIPALDASGPVEAKIGAMIPGVILAAGLSTRMGRSKASLPLAGPDPDTFLVRIARTFHEAGVEDVVVVLGHQAEAAAEPLLRSGLAARMVFNPHYASGQLSSVLAGLTAVDRPGVRAMLLTLVDVPLVAPSTVRAVLDRFDTTGAPIVRPVQGSRHGHPVAIGRTLFAAIRAADPQVGAKPIVRGHVSAAGDVEVDDEGAFLDIDTPEEYERILARLGSG